MTTAYLHKRHYHIVSISHGLVLGQIGHLCLYQCRWNRDNPDHNNHSSDT